MRPAPRTANSSMTLGDRAIGEIPGSPILESGVADLRQYRKQFHELAMVVHRETPKFQAGYYAEDDKVEEDRRAFALIRDHGLPGEISLRYWIMAALSRESLTPSCSIVVPGTTSCGFSRKRSNLSDVQFSPNCLMAAEYS